MASTGIYEIKNTVNGKRYVGSAVAFGNRWRQHAQSLVRGDHHSIALQRAWRSYGPSAFQFNKILVCSKENLLMYEQILLDALKPEYNCAPKAGSQLGLKMSEEARARMSASNNRRGNPGYAHTAESKAKISASKSGVKAAPEHVSARIAGIKRRSAWPAKRRFTEADIRSIRERIAAGEKQAILCKAYSVSDSVISEIKTRKAYGWVL